MAFIVEMSRGQPGEADFAEFSCGDNAWDQLLAIAKRFGWTPAGAIRDDSMAQRTSDYEVHFKSTYDPEEWAHCKRFGDDDAAELARALMRALAALESGENVVLLQAGPALLRDGMSVTQLERANANSRMLIERFARFAAGGGFAFAWDD